MGTKDEITNEALVPYSPGGAAAQVIAYSSHNETENDSGDHRFLSVFGTPLSEIRDRQRKFFQSGQTKGVAFRRRQLHRFLISLRQYEQDFITALNQDLGKSEVEAFSTEIGLLYHELKVSLRKIKSWTKPKRVRGSALSGVAKSLIYSEPRGEVLLISPWNYPVQLSLMPLIGAITAGNVVILKPSELAPNCSKVLSNFIKSTFDERHISVFEGGVELSQALLKQPWDYIFFTGSTKVGRIVAEAAARHLTPCTLELGGKSPCIVTSQANLDVACRRIVFGKFLNAGQTCIAPDYLLVEESIHERFLGMLKHEILLRYGSDPQSSPDYARIINHAHFDRLTSFLNGDPSLIAFGGKHDREKRYIAPTILDAVDFSHPVMNEEIFGPILPILTYRNLNQVLKELGEKPKPLAFYLFSENEKEISKVLRSFSFGGGCVNDTMMHFTNSRLPFGGVGESGMGAYHGAESFKTFSHFKSVLKVSTRFDPSIRYLPYRSWKYKILRFLFG